MRQNNKNILYCVLTNIMLNMILEIGMEKDGDNDDDNVEATLPPFSQNWTHFRCVLSNLIQICVYVSIFIQKKKM